MLNILSKYLKYNRETKKLSLLYAALNIRRIYFGSIAAMIVSLAHILIFALSPSHGETEVIWHRGIIIAHSVTLAVMAGIFITTSVFKRRASHGTAVLIFQYAVCVFLMAVGIAIVSIDQLVTPNITPYVIVCVIVGTLLILRPLYTLIIFIASYAAFIAGISLSPASPEIILSNISNGLAATIIGFMLSYVTWKYTMNNSKQEEFIRKQQLELESMAYFDPLTGLPNRRHFDEMINHEVLLSARQPRESSLVMLDIDHFKRINDLYGHPAGDSVLIKVGDILSGNIRMTDSLCRFGGEEFIILLPCTPLDKAAYVAEKLRKLIEQSEFEVSGRKLQVTASFGVSPLDYSQDPTLVSQYSSVDKALYTAKENGRNRVEIR